MFLCNFVIFNFFVLNEVLFCMGLFFFKFVLFPVIAHKLNLISYKFEQIIS